MKECASCLRGEEPGVEAEALVSYYNDDERRPVREWLCSGHLDTVYDDEGYGVREGSVSVQERA